ncbi:unnamed protein product [Rhizoctonia solani]|uniref:BAG domain-containing protein n=1 Tax=Rhizoctonia solani TaxID=456999 RepID=A0A8H3C5K3_9AGAM|nr:unnamed protein product [Rhizoctonia solani]
MNADHEIALMYTPSPWSLFQPSNGFYSPFSNVILRVVQPPRPNLEDLLLQFFTGDEVTTFPIEPEPEVIHSPQNEGEASKASDLTPDFDLSERMAREMQQQEDREQEMRDRAAAMRYQFGEYMSAFETSRPTIEGFRSMFPRESVNAEAGPSTIKKSTPTYASESNLSSGWSKLDQDQKMTNDGESSSDISDKVYGKNPARASQLDTANHNPSELLTDIEAHLKHKINQFDFPENLEFQPGSHTPTLLHTQSNAAVHAFEKALLDMRANLGVVEAGPNEDVIERRSRIDGRIQRELGDLDRKVLEAWAAKRRYSPAMGSRM